MIFNRDVPVLFLIFNRADKANEVFAAISRAKPKKLFVVADGPRTPQKGEAERCRVTRDVIKRIDWDCELKTWFREENLGCREGVAAAIDWFFDQVEEGIILEEDCVPADSFFPFCSNLLERYRENERVMMISGDNFQGGIQRGEASYYFSQIPHIWGWATWRRAWKHYDEKMAVFPRWLESHGAEVVWSDQDVRNFWLSKLIPTFEGTINTWDYQWAFSILRRNGLSVCPNMNLVSNIGFGKDATHTFDVDDACSEVSFREMSKMTHLNEIRINKVADNYEYKHLLNVHCHSIANPILRWRKLLRKRYKAKRLIENYLG